ncbi:hypothetical protein CY34DRAFT_773754 [Suillus luteus UH-Slu-Lm8-n1]|uniref:Uncharacterized protein n=1 Tax=Suillus luteus UH-Slu-Lm8-n1 TaxID=930992 RepID=A0A0D0A884_9AGAM|nr:hypothetical protein CY34DRAFT_773754 [Suillus luteus UH-Slu-Lm8-n1]
MLLYAAFCVATYPVPQFSGFRRKTSWDHWLSCFPRCSSATWTQWSAPGLTDGVTLNLYSRGLAWPEESERLHVQWLLLKFHKFASSARQERQPRATSYVRGQVLLDVDHHRLPMVSRYCYR